MITAEVLRPDALSAAELEAWAAFRAARPEFCNPLFGARWAQAVCRVRSDAFVSVLKQDGAAVGFLPHHRAGGGLARAIGAPFSDLHAMIVEPGRSLRMSDAVAASGLKAFRFSGLVDPEARASGAHSEAVAYVVVQREGEDTIELLRQRNAKRFKNWRRLGHKLEREVGPVILVAHDSSEAAYTQLLLWKRAQLRRSGLHDVYRPAWVQELMRNLQAAPDPDFGGLLITLYVGGQPVAGEFGVRENGCFHPWIAAYDPSLAPYSPGILLQMRIIEQMPALGLRRYDLSSGSDHYKIPMATDQLPTVAGTARAGDRAGANLSQALRRSRLGTRISQRWEQIAAAENTALGRVQGVVTAVRDGPRRWNGGGSVEV